MPDTAGVGVWGYLQSVDDVGATVAAFINSDTSAHKNA